MIVASNQHESHLCSLPSWSPPPFPGPQALSLPAWLPLSDAKAMLLAKLQREDPRTAAASEVGGEFAGLCCAIQTQLTPKRYDGVIACSPWQVMIAMHLPCDICSNVATRPLLGRLSIDSDNNPSVSGVNVRFLENYSAPIKPCSG